MGFLKRIFGERGWDDLPPVFVQSLKERLGKDDFFLLDHYAKKYKIFNQKFFQDTKRFESDPEYMLDTFALFIGSMGNQIVRQGSLQDAEHLYLISIKLKNEINPSHGCLALIYVQTNRIRDAQREAAIGLKNIEKFEKDSVPIPEEIATQDGLKNSFDDMREMLISIINLNDNEDDKESMERKEFKEEFEKATKALRNSDEVTQMAVGHSINLANSAFLQTYSGIEEFMNLPRQKQMDYIDKITAMEKKLTERDPSAALGFGLFKMWLGAITANDEELIENFSNELAYFSKKGDFTGFR